MKRLILSTIFAVVAFTGNAQQIDNVKLQQDFVKELNTYRVSKGLKPVSLNSNEISTAKVQANYCSSISTLTHDYPGGRVNVHHECALFNAELPNAKLYLSKWISSPSHNDQLLKDEITHIGIYYVKGFNSKLGFDGYYAVLVLNP
jgi:uncharacterized protein YkwD